MKPFMDQDFLLETPTATTLFHRYAKEMPIVDYHCHISPREIAEDIRFGDMAEAWLGADHYKWRLMRACGVPERLVTGDASGWEKFQAFATCLPRAIGNPVYHWAHLELKRYFGCETPLSGVTAPEVWDHCNRILREDAGMSVRGVIRRSNVRAIVTTDDPADDLRWHAQLQADRSFAATVVPAFRPDSALNIHKDDFVAYIGKLSRAAGADIRCLDDLCAALRQRMDHFAAHGCRASDHGVDAVVYAPAPRELVDEIFRARLSGDALSQAQAERYQYALLRFLAAEYAQRDWVMEVHYGVHRSVNRKAFDAIGPDSGYDTIGTVSSIEGLTRLLDELHAEGKLPKTLIFPINAVDNDAVSTLATAFPGEGLRARVQQGPAWWFNDTKTGMIAQLVSYANLSALGTSVGMLTDSRSFFSYTRHEYYRRILCNLLGGWVENGEYPDDLEGLGQVVQDICANNALAYFGF